MLRHNYIGTEHLLLGLLHDDDSVAAQALTALEVSLEQVRSAVLEIIGRGGTTPAGHVPFTPRAKKVLELSLREALQLGHNYIGTEHILLGLVREGEGVAAQVLLARGADVNRVRGEVINLLSAGGGERPIGGRREEEDSALFEVLGRLQMLEKQVRDVQSSLEAIRLTLERLAPEAPELPEEKEEPGEEQRPANP